MSKHTWEFEEKYLIEVREIIEKINSYPTDKITISGGEPFEQPQALKEILKGVRKTKNDILLYTGYSYKKVKKHWLDILQYIDVIVTNPFIEGMDTPLVWKGSENQEMIILNEGLKHRYFEYMKEKKTKTLQIIKSDGLLYLVGIPYQKDWEEVKKLYKSKNEI